MAETYFTLDGYTPKALKSRAPVAYPPLKPERWGGYDLPQEELDAINSSNLGPNQKSERFREAVTADYLNREYPQGRRGGFFIKFPQLNDPDSVQNRDSRTLTLNLADKMAGGTVTDTESARHVLHGSNSANPSGDFQGGLGPANADAQAALMQTLLPIIAGVEIERPFINRGTINRDDPFEGKALPLDYGIAIDSIRGEIDKMSGYDNTPWLNDEAIQYLIDNYPESFKDPNDSDWAAEQYALSLDRDDYNFTTDADVKDRAKLEASRTRDYLRRGLSEDAEPGEIDFFRQVSRNAEMQKHAHQVARERFNKFWPYAHKTRGDQLAQMRTDNFLAGDHPLSERFLASANKPMASFDWQSVFNQYDPADNFRSGSGDNSQLFPEILEYINRQ